MYQELFISILRTPHKVGAIVIPRLTGKKTEAHIDKITCSEHSPGAWQPGSFYEFM